MASSQHVERLEPRVQFSGGVTQTSGSLTAPADGPAAAVHLGSLAFVATQAGDVDVYDAAKQYLGSDMIDIYDGRTGQWSTTQFPHAGDYGGAATGVGTKAIFASVGSGLTDAVHVYDAATGTWSTARLSQARYPVAVSVGRFALFAGGIRTSKTAR